MFTSILLGLVVSGAVYAIEYTAATVYDGKKAAKAAAKPNETFGESDFTEEDDDDDLFCEITSVEAEVCEEQESEELPPRDKSGKFIKKDKK